MSIESLNDFPTVAKYILRVGAEPRSLKVAVVREEHGLGYWTDKAIIKFTQEGEVTAPEGYKPTPEEETLIKHEMSSAEWPTHVHAPDMSGLPEPLASAGRDQIFDFRDEKGDIIMIQFRQNKKDGTKIYTPWTFWSDNRWRCAEPETLPLYGLDQLKDNAVIILHEGPKAARAMRDMVEQKTPEMREKFNNHPWRLQLSNAAHIGWAGGAMSPHRSNWEPLLRNGITRMYIVSDWDEPGISAVPKIAQNVNLPTFHVQFNDDFPKSFDLADPMPEKLFKDMDGRKVWIGPSFNDCLQPATWATDRVEYEDELTGKKKQHVVVRNAFRSQWVWVETADVWVNTHIPNIIRSSEILDRMVRPFCHTDTISKLMLKSYTGRVTKLTYLPSKKERLVTEDNVSAINVFQESPIKPIEGDPAPWLEFLSYLFPNKEECHEVKRWSATLLAKPEVRMLYGILCVSERQGQGKSLLGRIYANLVGVQNVSSPSDQALTNSAYNAWIAKKRLIISNEVYSGSSWKAYNALKSAITDETIHVSEKYEKGYDLTNWAHFYLCSNSLEALKIEETDRRLLYPEVTEIAWPKKRFNELVDWLEADGYGIIRYWAENLWTDYVKKGEDAPNTKRKIEAIENSRSAGQNAAIDLARVMNASEQPIAVTMNDVMEFIHRQYQYGEKSYDRPLGVKKAMKEGGVIWSKERISVNSRTQNVGFNKALAEKMKGLGAESALRMAKEYIKVPSELMEERF